MYSLTTFNANNFYLRYKFSGTYPGDKSKKSLVEAGNATMGYLPELTLSGKLSKGYIVWDPIRRKTAAQALKAPDDRLPDVLCLQEVENMQTIRAFNESYLDGYYPHSLLIDGYDPRNIDVGVLSRFPLEVIRSHLDDREGRSRVFSRDCLEITVRLSKTESLTLLVNHLKSKLVTRARGDTEADYHRKIRNSNERRLGQAKAIAGIVEKRFKGRQDSALYAVVGDFNDTFYSPYLAPLIDSHVLTNVVSEFRGDDDSWTYYLKDRNRVSQIDFVLASNALAKRIRKVVKHDPDRKPHIERRGLSYDKNKAGDIKPVKLVHFEPDPVTPEANGHPPATKSIPFDFDRFEAVAQDWRNNISDHCPVKVFF